MKLNWLIQLLHHDIIHHNKKGISSSRPNFEDRGALSPLLFSRTPPLMILEAAVLESAATGALESTATGLGALAADLALVIDLRDLAKRPNFAKPFI